MVAGDALPGGGGGNLQTQLAALCRWKQFGLLKI